MPRTLKLLLPALIPSWRFFDEIAPSPRIEFALLKTPQDAPEQWREFRPRPAQLSMACILKRLFWNPRWNETLFLVSCAERLMEKSEGFHSQEILTRIKADLERDEIDVTGTPYLQFRLALISRQDAEIRKDIMFVSPVHAYFSKADP